MLFRLHHGEKQTKKTRESRPAATKTHTSTTNRGNRKTDIFITITRKLYTPEILHKQTRTKEKISRQNINFASDDGNSSEFGVSTNSRINPLLSL